jgi:3-deoxy-manno-octulosonate cytidylyltransferase (CMP-KDO synthetase)
MTVFAFIPARYASSRFPGKPLVPIKGTPMIQRVYERAKACPGLTEVVVATDDRRILDCVEGFRGKAVLTGEHRSGTDRICEAAMAMGLGHRDIVVNIQGDQPLFDPSTVARLVAPLKTDPSVPISTLKWKMEDPEDAQNPNHVKVVTDKNGFALYFSRAPIPAFRDLSTRQVYYKHLGLYAYRMEALVRLSRLPEGILEAAEKLEQLRALEHGFKIKVEETPHNSIEVDVPTDVEIVEQWVRE